MIQNPVRAKLKRGEHSIGTWLSLPDPVAARLMARVGFEWLTVELEHAPVTIDIAAQSFTAIVAGNCVPLARLPSNTDENIKRVLDIGAYGVVVPMVNSRAEAESAVRAARYQPLGERPIGGQLHAANFDTDPATYYARANDEILLVLMAEHIKAIEAAEDILSVPGIDVVFVGPNDLHNSMGQKPVFDSDDKQFTEALRHILRTAKKHGVAPGIHVATPESASRRISEGFQFIAVSSETGMMLARAQEIASKLGLGSGHTVARY